MILEKAPTKQDSSLSPPRKEIKTNTYVTPKKNNKLQAEEISNFTSPQYNSENRHTPILKSKDFKQAIENQSTEAHHTMLSGSPMLDWKTPQSFLKTNPFGGFSNQSTPISSKAGNGSNHHTPMSPYSDRYIPFRQENVSRNIFQVAEKRPILPFEISESTIQPELPRNSLNHVEEEEKQQKTQFYQTLLQEKLLDIKPEQKEGSKHSILSFKNTKLIHQNEHESSKFISQESPIQFQQTANKRKIDAVPFKVLDAPGLQDDFYQDVLHWGKANLIAVGLASQVYLYNYSNSKTMKITQGDQAYYTSLQWNASGTLLGLGTYEGSMMFWDAGKQSGYTRSTFCQKRIASISWANSNVFACGSKDKSILIGDMRTQHLVVHRLYQAHSQEICGLAFSDNEHTLASGGNDNKVHIWSLKGGIQGGEYDSTKNFLQWTMRDHKAAIRALSWNPNCSGILATGGGSADKTIKILNTLTNTIVNSIEVDSQVCKLKFSHNTNEFVTAHGYEKNQIMLWQYPQAKRTHYLEGHNHRVLYMSLSPDHTTMVTGSADETLKFWNIFPPHTQPKTPEIFKITDFR